MWVSLIIPANPNIGLGFNPDGTVDAVPSLQLIILPLTSTFLALTGFFTGLYYFRWEKTQMISFVLWVSSAAGKSIIPHRNTIYSQHTHMSL